MADHQEPSLLEEQLSRRQLLKRGAIGAAGLTVIPAVLAACGTSATPSPAATQGTTTPTATPAAGAPTPTAAAGGGTITFGSNYSDAVPKKAMADVAAAFTAKTNTKVTINTVDHGTFQDQITNYLGGKPDDTFTWFSGFRMRYFAAQGFAVQIDDVWQTLSSNFSDAFKVGSTGDDGHQYFVPFYNYPWAVFYRKDVWAAKGYQIPTTIDDVVTLCK